MLDPLLIFDEGVHEYRHNGVVVPSVTQVLDVAGKFREWNSAALQEAKERGTAVHLICHLYDMGDLDDDSVDDIYRPYLDAYIRFKRESGIQIVESEQQIWHPIYCYAGTLDRIGNLGRKRALIDLKTGGDYPTFGPQTAAYAKAWERENGKKIDERFILKLRDDGTYRLTPQKNPQDFGVFQACLTVHRYFHKGKS